jgi:hypothetical protein
MLKKTVLTAVLSAVVLSTAALSLPAQAATAHPCQADVAKVQAEWDKMVGMGQSMESAKSNYGLVTAVFAEAKQDCQRGDVAATEAKLNLVRRHLGLEEHSAPHDRV